MRHGGWRHGMAEGQALTSVKCARLSKRPPRMGKSGVNRSPELGDDNFYFNSKQPPVGKGVRLSGVMGTERRRAAREANERNTYEQAGCRCHRHQ
jgi:hypothetical protein